MKNKVYKVLAISNDIKAIRKGRILNRIWNRGLLKLVRKFMK